MDAAAPSSAVVTRCSREWHPKGDDDDDNRERARGIGGATRIHLHTHTTGVKSPRESRPWLTNIEAAIERGDCCRRDSSFAGRSDMEVVLHEK
uniref:Uncharacterized protein n=1 Tax=Peronospora matthiolae TaxID=2874970 RepID=A0AAV1U9H5_9STRA